SPWEILLFPQIDTIWGNINSLQLAGPTASTGAQGLGSNASGAAMPPATETRSHDAAGGPRAGTPSSAGAERVGSQVPGAALAGAIHSRIHVSAVGSGWRTGSSADAGRGSPRARVAAAAALMALRKPRRAQGRRVTGLSAR